MKDASKGDRVEVRHRGHNSVKGEYVSERLQMQEKEEAKAQAQEEE